MKRAILHTATLALSLGLVACDSGGPGLKNGGATASDEVKKAMQAAAAETALFVTKDGQLVVMSARGKPLAKCQAPGGRGDGLAPCKSFQKGSTVQLVNHLVYVRTKINPYCEVWIDSAGYAYEDCDHQ